MPEGIPGMAIAIGIVVFAAAVVVVRRIGQAESNQAARLNRVRDQTDSVPATTIPELIDIVHKKAVARLSRDRLKSDDPGLRKDLTRVIEHLFDVESPMMNRLEREEAIKAVVDRMIGPRPE